MAFLGRMNSKGKFIDSEASNGSKVNLAFPDDIGNAKSRTYVKTYDTERRNLVSSPGTVRYVGDSASFYELNSMADTEVSTLRYVSPRSLEDETESLTLCLSRSEKVCESTSSSMSEGNIYSDQCKEAELCKRGSTTSMCSWEEEPISVSERQENELESQSCCVPMLELGSDTASLYYDHEGNLGQLKLMRQSNEAYENWLSAKKRQSQYKRFAAQEQREQEQHKDALRRQLNEQKVQEWCNQKARKTIKPSNTSSNIRERPQTHLGELALRRLQAWELNKVQQAEKRRQQQQREAARKQQELLQRKQKSTLAWQQWVKDSAERPKPVPLNQGLKTLRGTVSDIYINPNQWVHVNKEQGSK